MATVGAREREERERKEFEAWQLKLLRDRDFDAIVSLLEERRVVLDLRDPDFAWTPLLFAADGGAVQLINRLLDSRAKIEAFDEECNTPLCVAARQGHLQAVQLLTARKANLDAQNRGGWTPLVWASMGGHDEVVAALLDLRASFYVVDALGRTALMWAARHGHTVVAETLLFRGVDFTRRDEDGLNAADHAQEHFELRASIVLAEERSRRLLEAAQRNDLEAVRQAIEAGAGVDTPDETGWSPLAWAMLLESRPLVEVLVQHGANPFLLGEEADIGEQLTVKHSQVTEVLKDVLEANGVLLRAARAGYYKCAERQLKAGAWINVQDEEERTPLMWAARRGSVLGTNLFLGKGALVNARDRIGFSAFLYAVLSGNIEVASMLHHYHADIYARSYYGHTALHLAVKVEDAKMVQVLLAAGMDVNEKDYQNRAPLHAAVANGQMAVVHTLVFCQADLHARDHESRTPLCTAVCEEQFSICEVFLRKTQLVPPEPVAIVFPEVSEEEDAVPPPAGEDDAMSDSSLHSERSSEGSGKGVHNTLSLAGKMNIKTPKAGSRRPSGLVPKQAGSRRPSGMLASPSLKQAGGSAGAKTPLGSSCSGSRRNSGAGGGDGGKVAKTATGRSTAAGGDSGKVTKTATSRSNAGGGDSGKVGKTPTGRSNAVRKTPTGRSDAGSKILASPGNATGSSAPSMQSSRRPSALSAFSAMREESAELPTSDNSSENSEQEGSQQSEGEEDKHRSGSKASLRRTSLVVLGATRIKVATEKRQAAAKAQAKASPVARRREQLLARFEGPLCLVKAAAEWRLERLGADKPPQMPEPEELYVDEDIHGRRPLQLAARVPSKSISALLLEVYADVKFLDNSKTNALIEASRSGDAEVVELLLAHDGDIRHRNKDGDRAVDVAANREVKEILEKAVVKKRVPNRPLSHQKSAMGAPAEDSQALKPAIFRVRLERLPRQIEGELLRRHIRRLLRELGAGRPLSVEVLLDPITEKPKGVAFADFAEERAAEAALTGNGEDFLDHEIAIFRDLPMAMVR